MALRQAAGDLLLQLDPQAAAGLPADIDVRSAAWDRRYRQVKTTVLQAGALGTLTPAEMELLLRSNSALRRAVHQASKAALAAQDAVPVATVH